MNGDFVKLKFFVCSFMTKSIGGFCATLKDN